MIRGWKVIPVLLIGLGASAGDGAAQLTDSAATTAAQRFIDLLEAGDWAGADAMVAPALRDRLGAAQLEMIWGQIAAGLGAGTVERVRGVTAVDAMKSVELYGDFARDTVMLRIVLSPETEVVGFWVGPVPDEAPAATPGPSYADASKFREGEVRVGADPWQLPGTLTVPVSGGPHPVIVLVHGSGPQDRDETVGGTKVFRDLAWGLASRGIAVLRYEKRTKVHGAKMTGEVTVEQEVIEDALAALELVRAHPEIDAARVYVAGHSLGATLAPEIARRDGRLAGAVLLAATARPIGDVILEQLAYIGGLPENAGAEAQAQISGAREQAARLASPETPDTALIMGAPVSYFRDLDRRSAAAEALKSDTPLLVLQGGRDYQVTMEDFGLLGEALKDRPRADFQAFPALNHLFVAGTGPSTPSEYAQPGFVAEEVVAAIAAWIRE